MRRHFATIKHRHAFAFAMPYDDPPDEEDWYDEDDEADDAESAPCPECGELVYDFSERCPDCGYWLTGADRRAMWATESKPAWLKLTAVLLLLVFLGTLLATFRVF